MAYGGLTRLATLKIRDRRNIEIWHGKPQHAKEYWQVDGHGPSQRHYNEADAWDAFKTGCHYAIQDASK